MANDDVRFALTYHNATKHSASSIQASPHYLDWQNQPLPFKIYTSIDPIRLPQDADPTGISALSALSEKNIGAGREKIPALKDLARILFFSAGITKKRTSPGGEMYFRAASCTGALYEFELYLVCGVLAHATGGETRVVQAPVTIVCAGTYWRNSWKYRARTYRHFGWDNGTMLANMLAMTSALRLPAEVVCGFVDSEVNQLLDVDPEHEVAFSMVPIGHLNPGPPEASLDIPKLGLPTVPLSNHEVDYPEMREMHEASSLATAQEVVEWRARAKARDYIEEMRASNVVAGFSTHDTIEEVILRRGSSRQFERQPITLEQLSTMLRAATQGIPADFLTPHGTQLNDLYLIVNAVDGLQPGAYVYEREAGDLHLLKEGQFRNEARYLGLQQDLPGDAAADVFFLADLEAILARFGNRGYRAVQLESGIIGGKLYLAAYAQHLGATGLTFFDDDVVKFFSPHAAGKSAIFLVALGKGRKVR